MLLVSSGIGFWILQLTNTVVNNVPGFKVVFHRSFHYFGFRIMGFRVGFYRTRVVLVFTRTFGLFKTDVGSVGFLLRYRLLAFAKKLDFQLLDKYVFQKK